MPHSCTRTAKRAALRRVSGVAAVADQSLPKAAFPGFGQLYHGPESRIATNVHTAATLRVLAVPSARALPIRGHVPTPCPSPHRHATVCTSTCTVRGAQKGRWDSGLQPESHVHGRTV